MRVLWAHIDEYIYSSFKWEMLTFELARALDVIQDVCIKTQKTWIYIFPGTCKLQKPYFISIVRLCHGFMSLEFSKSKLWEIWSQIVSWCPQFLWGPGQVLKFEGPHWHTLFNQICLENIILATHIEAFINYFASLALNIFIEKFYK